MTTESNVDPLFEPHEPHWISQAAFPIISALLMLSQIALWWAVRHDLIWLAVPLVLVVSHLMHGQLIGFHEASHGLLRKSRRLNEIDGVLIGTISLTSFSLYRAAHQTHHMHLGSERDEELWPFNLPETARWKRRLAAFLELFAGLVFTPTIFLRTFLREGSPIRSRKVRRRIWSELVLMAVVWTAAITLVAGFGAWKYFLWLYFIPAVVAGNLQSWRKYIEHVGMTGASIRSATRSIVADNWLGKIISFSLLHEPFHGVHHQRAGLRHAELPGHVADLQPQEEDEFAPFPSYGHAFMHLLGTLADPQVGVQWKRRADAHNRTTA